MPHELLRDCETCPHTGRRTAVFTTDLGIQIVCLDCGMIE